MMPAHVTIHAVRRYAERAMQLPVSAELDDVEAMHDLACRGVDLQAIRDRIHDACDDAADRGAIGVKFDNIRARIVGTTIVTILEKGPAGHVYERSL